MFFKYVVVINLFAFYGSFYCSTISDNNIGQWLPFPPYPLPNVVLQVQKNIQRKVDIIVATLKEGKRGRAFVWGWPETFGWDCSLRPDFSKRLTAHAEFAKRGLVTKHVRTKSILLLAEIVFLVYARNFDGPFSNLSRDIIKTAKRKQTWTTTGNYQ